MKKEYKKLLIEISIEFSGILSYYKGDNYNNIKLNDIDESLYRIKNKLNDFFDDAICTKLFITDNTNGIFFGMCVYELNKTEKYIKKDMNSKPKYILEMDSRLFSKELDLHPDEIVAFLLHEIGHLVCSKSIDKDVYDMTIMTSTQYDIDFIEFLKHKKSFKDISQFIDYSIYLTKRKMYSIFEQNKEEFIADDFVVNYGYGSYLSSGFKKIIKNRKWALVNPSHNGIALIWAFKTISFLKTREHSVQYQINAIESCTGSKIEKENIRLLRKIGKKHGFCMESTQDNEYTDEYKTMFLNEFFFIRNMRRKGLQNLEDDLYEFNIRLKNLDSEAQAIDMIRDVNYKINLLKDYIDTYKKECNVEYEQALLDKYIYLRDQISKTQIYKDKYYGLFVEIPKVKGRYEL